MHHQPGDVYPVYNTMKKSYYRIIIMLSVMAIYLGMGAINRPEKTYVCLPCGQACDSKVHDKPGVCPSCSMELVDQQSIKFTNIDFMQLCSRIKANKEIVLLDVRSKEEFDNTTESVNAFGRFKNAININIHELKDRVSELDQWKDKEIIVYCSHSHRSPQASYFLTAQGFKNVKNVSGGVSTLQPENGLECLREEYITFPARK